MLRAQVVAAGALLVLGLAATAHAYQDSESATFEETAPATPEQPVTQEQPIIEEQPAAAEQPLVQESPVEQPPAPSPVAAVLMQTLAFDPKLLEVPAGTTVVWTNLDPFEHTVTADDGSYDSTLIPAGGTFSLTFTAPGTYSYYCVPHGSPGGGGMAGVVAVF
jgi:plastocyanin